MNEIRALKSPSSQREAGRLAALFVGPLTLAIVLGLGACGGGSAPIPIPGAGGSGGSGTGGSGTGGTGGVVGTGGRGGTGGVGGGTGGTIVGTADGGTTESKPGTGGDRGGGRRER